MPIPANNLITKPYLQHLLVQTYINCTKHLECKITQSNRGGGGFNFGLISYYLFLFPPLSDLEKES